MQRKLLEWYRTTSGATESEVLRPELSSNARYVNRVQACRKSTTWSEIQKINIQISTKSILENSQYKTQVRNLSVTKLTSWSWDILEKPPIVQLLKNFPAFYGTRRFITVFTSSLHWSWARSIQSIPPHPTSLRSVSTLSTHLRT
jgi:hypothetical protein